MPEPNMINASRAIREAAAVLSAAGVGSPRTEAELLTAYVLGVARGRLVLAPGLDPAQARRLSELVAARAARVPLQHLTGTAAFHHIELAVGPGVFVPRPETELLVEWGLAVLDRHHEATVVDLCSGSGAIALAVASARPAATVYAVERDPAALRWLRRNVRGGGHRRGDYGGDQGGDHGGDQGGDYGGDHGGDPGGRSGDGARVRVVAGDAADPRVLSALDGQVDLVLCNPPYVPSGAAVPPEVAGHDPYAAVFAGDDGLDLIRRLVSRVAVLLRPGGRFGVEHDDSHGEAVPALLRADGRFDGIADHRDLTGRPRFATARLATTPARRV